MEGKYGYCTNNDGIFSGVFDTRKEAVEAARCGRCTGGPFETGRYKRVMFTIDVNNIIDSLNEHARAEAGDVAEDFLYYVPKSQRDNLQEALNTTLSIWLMRYEYDQEIYSVLDIHEHQERSPNEK